MKNKLLIILILGLTLFLFSCGQDKSSDTPKNNVASNINPSGVPVEDLVPVDNGKQEGGGEIIAITGNSASPTGNDGVTGDNEGKGDKYKEGEPEDDSGKDGTEKEDNSTGDTGKDVEDDGDDSTDGSGSEGSDKENPSNGDNNVDDTQEGPCNIKGNSPVRHGKDVCYLEGKWFMDGNTIFTYQQNQCACYRYHKLKSGKYEITLKVRQWVKQNKKGSLPEGFTAYKVLIAADGVMQEVSIPASANGYEQGSAELDLTGGVIDICVEWLNGYCQGDDCVNLQLQSLKIKRTGDSERSAITAYLLTMQNRNKALLVSFFLSLVFALGVIYIWNKKRVKNLNNQ